MTLLTRLDIADRLRIPKHKFDNLVDKKKIVLPAPVSKDRSTLLYSEQSINAFIATDPLIRKTGKQKPTLTPD